MWTALGAIAVVLLVLYVLNSRGVIRLWGAGSAQVGKLGRWAANRDPLAILQEKVDDAADNLRAARDGLDQANGNVQSLERQVNFGRQEKAKLEARIRGSLSENNEEKANRYAADLARVERDLSTNEAQLENAVHGRDIIKNQITAWQRKVQAAKQEAQDLGLQLKMSEAEAAMAGLVHKMASMGDPLNDLNEARSAVQAKIDQNRGKLQTAQQLNEVALEEMADDEAAQRAEAASILDRFRQPQGQN
jgi:phage shock protein A